MLTQISLSVSRGTDRVTFMVNAVRKGQRYQVRPSEIMDLVNAVHGIDYGLSNEDGGTLIPMTPGRTVWALCP